MKRVLLNVCVLMVVALTACGGGSGRGGSFGRNSAITLEEFKRRFNEVRENSSLGDGRYLYSDFHFAHYAASNKSLEEFKRRFNEVRENSSLGDGRYLYSDFHYAYYAAN